MNKILILDIGNSLIKISDINYLENKINKTYLFGTRNFLKWKKDIKKIFETLDYEKILIGSVVPSMNEEILSLIQKKEIVYFFKNEDFNFIKFDKNISLNEIGIDILAFANFMISQNKDSIGISFGTAIFSIIIKNNIVMGISIFPSINKAFEDLTTRTELISNVVIDELRIDFGFSNKESIESGYYHLVSGMINSILNYANVKYNVENVFIAGGNCKNIHNFKFNKKFNLFLDEEQIVTMGYLLLFKNFLN